MATDLGPAIKLESKQNKQYEYRKHDGTVNIDYTLNHLTCWGIEWIATYGLNESVYYTKNKQKLSAVPVLSICFDFALTSTVILVS